jgi:hypothetical protein
MDIEVQVLVNVNAGPASFIAARLKGRRTVVERFRWPNSDRFGSDWTWIEQNRVDSLYPRQSDDNSGRKN